MQKASGSLPSDRLGLRRGAFVLAHGASRFWMGDRTLQDSLR